MLLRPLLWNQYEERRTVLGPDIDKISELRIRLENKLPIRYVYQGIGSYYYESAKFVIDTLKQAGENIDEVLKINKQTYYIDAHEKCIENLTYIPFDIKVAMAQTKQDMDIISLF